MKELRGFVLQPFLVGLVIVAALVILFGGMLFLASIFGNVVYWIVAVIVLAWFLGFTWMATRG